MASPVSRVQIATDAQLTTHEVVAPGDAFHGIFNVESSPAGLVLSFRFGRNGSPVIIPVGGGIVAECDIFTDGLFLDTNTAVPGGAVVVQIAKVAVSNAS